MYIKYILFNKLSCIYTELVFTQSLESLETFINNQVVSIYMAFIVLSVVGDRKSKKRKNSRLSVNPKDVPLLEDLF